MFMNWLVVHSLRDAKLTSYTTRLRLEQHFSFFFFLKKISSNTTLTFLFLKYNKYVSETNKYITRLLID